MALSGNSIVTEVEKFVGDPYVYGGESPSGFDCSGLVQYVLGQVGVSGVPRTSEEQYAWATKIQKNQLQPGDLVFAQFPGDNASPGHVGVYTGNGQVLSAEDPALGVGYASLSSWGGNIVGYGRVPGSTAGSSSNTSGTPTPGSSPGGVIGFAESIPLMGGLFTAMEPFLHAVATVIDYSFGVFEPGQGLRIAFGAGALVLLYLSYKVLASSGAVPQGLVPRVVPV